MPAENARTTKGQKRKRKRKLENEVGNDGSETSSKRINEQPFVDELQTNFNLYQSEERRKCLKRKYRDDDVVGNVAPAQENEQTVQVTDKCGVKKDKNYWRERGFLWETQRVRRKEKVLRKEKLRLINDRRKLRQANVETNFWISRAQKALRCRKFYYDTVVSRLDAGIQLGRFQWNMFQQAEDVCNALDAGDENLVTQLGDSFVSELAALGDLLSEEIALIRENVGLSTTEVCEPTVTHKRTDGVKNGVGRGAFVEGYNALLTQLFGNQTAGATNTELKFDNKKHRDGVDSELSETDDNDEMDGFGGDTDSELGETDDSDELDAFGDDTDIEFSETDDSDDEMDVIGKPTDVAKREAIRKLTAAVDALKTGSKNNMADFSRRFAERFKTLPDEVLMISEDPMKFVSALKPTAETLEKEEKKLQREKLKRSQRNTEQDKLFRQISDTLKSRVVTTFRNAFNKMYKSELDKENREYKASIEDLAEDNTCPICIGTLEESAFLGCGHTFCYNCIDRWFYNKPTCPMCRRFITRISESYMMNDVESKVNELLDALSTAEQGNDADGASDDVTNYLGCLALA